MSILNFIFGQKNQAQNKNQSGTGYGDYGYWSQYGRTDPNFWQNLGSDTGMGNWGNLSGQNSTMPGTGLNYGQGNQKLSLLDILASLNRNRYGGF